MSRILAIDPGNVSSALIGLEYGRVTFKAYDVNAEIRAWIKTLSMEPGWELVIEQIESFGMAVGATVFETCFESGRFAELWHQRTAAEAHRLPRRAVKLHLCNSARAKDANVRQAVMDRYGSTREQAIGRKASPGPLYGVGGDLWAALAVALTFHDQTAQRASQAVA